VKIHQDVQRALKSGDLVPQPCEKCGNENAVAHHDDLARPLDVRWLCRVCHFEWHSENVAANHPNPPALRDRPSAGLAARIRQARQAVGLSQTQLAHAVHVTPRSLQWYESGERDVPSAVLYLIAQTTGQPMDWFYSENERSPA